MRRIAEDQFPSPPRAIEVMMTKILIVDGHPDPDRGRFVHALVQAYVQAAQEAGHEVKTIDVATAGIGVLHSGREWETETVSPEVKQAQDLISWAGHIVIVFPLWLGSMPALLKGFFERVLRPGFAIGKGKRALSSGLLKGKSARVVVTMGMPAFFYRLFFFTHSVSSLRRNLLYFVGIKPVRQTLIGSIENASSRERGLALMRKLGVRGG